MWLIPSVRASSQFWQSQAKFRFAESEELRLFSELLVAPIKPWAVGCVRAVHELLYLRLVPLEGPSLLPGLFAPQIMRFDRPH